MQNKLTLHCGATETNWDAVTQVITPEPVGIHHPISHASFVNRVREALGGAGLMVSDETHALTQGGARYFGLLQVEQQAQAKASQEVIQRVLDHIPDAAGTERDYSWVLGLRNSHDKSFAASCVAGARVFVCDNLSFSGEIQISRKCTKFIERDLPMLVNRVVGKLGDRWNDFDRRITAYREYQLDDREAHDLAIRMLDIGVVGCTQLPKVLEQFRKPAHPEHGEHRLWTLYNGVTEVLKGVQPAMLVNRTDALHGLLDTRAGLAPQRAPVDRAGPGWRRLRAGASSWPRTSTCKQSSRSDPIGATLAASPGGETHASESTLAVEKPSNENKQ